MSDAVGKLSKQLESAKALSSNLTKPASALASLVSKMVLDGYRQRQLRNAINEANPHVQAIGAGISQLTAGDDGFGLALRAEKTAISDYYDYWITEAQKEPVAGEIMRRKKEDALADFGDRDKAIKSYGAVMQKIAKGHQTLFDKQQSLDDKVLLKEIRKYATEIRDTMQTIKDAAK